jgi:polygalacturonase
LSSTAAALLLAAGSLLSGCAGSQSATGAPQAIHISGSVRGGQQAVLGATIQLYAAGTTGDGSAATALLKTTVTSSDGTGNATNANANPGNGFNSLPAGAFSLDVPVGSSTAAYTCPTGSLVYLTSTAGNSGFGANNPNIAMMAALGPCTALTSSTYIIVNELTTAGSLAALAPFTTSYTAIGSGTSDAAALATAFTTANEYVNMATGTAPGTTLPSGTYASTLELQTLADALAACVNSSGGTAGQMNNCGTLFTAATPTSGTAPTDTIGATLNILNNPGLNIAGTFGLAQASSPFQPTLSTAPSSWVVPIYSLGVTVSGPTTATIGQTAQYTAAVTGARNQLVTWMVNGVIGGNAASGTISTTGLYTPPSTAPASAVTIAAVSVLASTASGSLSVTVAPVTVAVSGPLNVLLSGTGQYAAVVTGSANQAVTWLVNNVASGNSTTGTISTTGLYTPPAAVPASPVTISAQSSASTPAATGSLGITVSTTAITYATGDSRTVTQPVYPAVCQVLTAQFNTSQRAAPPATDDTSRLQAALTACKNTGQAVELAPSSTSNAFYSALLNVTGEGLLIDAGVTLEGDNTYSGQSELLNVTGANSSIMAFGTSGVNQGTIDGRGDLLTGSSTRLVQTNTANNFIAYNITLQQSIYPNLYIQGGNGATVWGVTILTPATRSNADGIDIDSMTNATVTNSTIEAGDDGVAVKPNNASASNVTVTNNRLYGTHGLSIGSIPRNTVSNVLFLNNYVYGTDLVGNISANANGLVIKQDPSCSTTVSQITYQNTCMKGVKHLITFYTNYSGSCSGSAGNPVFSNILVNGVLATNSISGAYSEFIGTSAAASSSVALANVSLDSNALNTGSNASQYTSISLENSSLTSTILTGATTTGMTTSTFATPGSVPTCSF